MRVAPNYIFFWIITTMESVLGKRELVNDNNAEICAKNPRIEADMPMLSVAFSDEELKAQQLLHKTMVIRELLDPINLRDHFHKVTLEYVYDCCIDNRSFTHVTNIKMCVDCVYKTAIEWSNVWSKYTLGCAVGCV